MQVIHFISAVCFCCLLISCDNKTPSEESTPEVAAVISADEITTVENPIESAEDYATQKINMYEDNESLSDPLFREQIISTEELKTFLQSAFNMEAVKDYADSWDCFGFEDSKTIIYVGETLDMFSCTNSALESMLNHNLDASISLRKEGITQAMQNYAANLDNGFSGSAFDGIFPVNLFWEGDEDTRFNYVNKNAVIWIAANVIPSPDMKINGVKAQDLYDHILKNLCRSMMFYYHHLHNDLDIEKELRWYNRMMNDADTTAAGEWLYFRYNQQEYPQPGILMSEKQTPAYFIGFWLRRNIDGSDGELRIGLEKIMQLYDSTWLEKLNQQFQ